MRTIDLVRLLVLAAIWGGSFIFMRVLAPVLGAIPTANSRVLIAGLVLTLYFTLSGFKIEWRKNWKQYLFIGILGSGIPFALFAYAAISIPASYEVILNSTAPLFGAFFSWIWLDDIMDKKKLLGLLIAASGVAIVVNLGAAKITLPFLLAVIACLMAAVCYGLTSIYIKKFANQLNPKAVSAGSLLLVGLIMLPFSATQTINTQLVFEPKIIFCILGLALICSATAYLLYYQLLADIGPMKALTVTFLMPIFGIMWGFLFLGEPISRSMVLGTITILFGTWLVVQKK